MKKLANNIGQSFKSLVIDFFLTFFSLLDWRNDSFSCSEKKEKKGLYRWLLAAAVLFGAFLRIFIFLREPQVGPDAVYYLEISEMWSRSSFSALLENDPLFYIPPVMLGIIQFFIRMGCSPLPAGIALNLIFGIGLIPLFYLTGRYLFDTRKAGVIAAFLISFNPVLVDYSANIMRENFMLFFEAAFLLFAVLGFRKKNIFFGPSGFFLAWAVFSRYEALEILPLMVFSSVWFAALRVFTWKKILVGNVYFWGGLAVGCILLIWVFGIPFHFFETTVMRKIEGTLL